MSKQTTGHAGLEALHARPLLETMWQRRTHRVPRGIGKIAAGSMTYESDTHRRCRSTHSKRPS